MIPTAWQAAGLLPALGLSLSAQSSTVTHHRRGRERGASASGGASGVLLPEAEEGPEVLRLGRRQWLGGRGVIDIRSGPDLGFFLLLSYLFKSGFCFQISF